MSSGQACNAVAGSVGGAIQGARPLELLRRHWDRRLRNIDQELQTEPERIKSVYAVKAQRVEPVGLVYLWPVTG